MHFYALCLLSQDPLGRLHLDDLSQQQRMELFIEGLTEGTKTEFQDSEGDFLPVCAWPDVECDDDGIVTKISIRNAAAGELDFRFIPPTIEYVYISGDKVLRIDNSIAHREGMETFWVASARFTENIEIAALPRSMRARILEGCGLCGTCDLIALPEKMKQFSIPNNHCHGEVRLNSLPQTLSSLDLSLNNFSGELDLEHRFAAASARRPRPHQPGTG